MQGSAATELRACLARSAQDAIPRAPSRQVLPGLRHAARPRRRVGGGRAAREPGARGRGEDNGSATLRFARICLGSRLHMLTLGV